MINMLAALAMINVRNGHFVGRKGEHTMLMAEQGKTFDVIKKQL
jgi:hypothetical protein